MRSILEPKQVESCYICGQERRYLEEHHVFGGPNRKLSEKHGLKVHLCLECHRDSKIGVHFNKERRMELQAIAQKEFENKYGHEKFMEIFGKSWI